MKMTDGIMQLVKLYAKHGDVNIEPFYVQIIEDDGPELVVTRNYPKDQGYLADPLQNWSREDYARFDEMRKKSRTAHI